MADRHADTATRGAGDSLVTADMRRFALWAGIGAGAVLLGFIILLVRGASESTTGMNASRLHAAYVKAYHPDKPNGLAVEAAQTELRTKVALQNEELTATVSALSPPLPEPYTKTDLADVGNQIRTDYAAIRQLASRIRIAIPLNLPFEKDLDAAPKIRARQLVWLRLVCLSMETCLQAGVSKLNSVGPGECFGSPSKNDAVFTCNLELEATWDVGIRLLAGLATADGRGLGLRHVEIAVNADKTQRIKLTTQLTTPNRDIWELIPAAESPTRDAANTIPASTAPTIRRLGGPRP
ncbi:MAG: hypothetical protein AAB263_06840 [Planctomycetota bacterium]